MKIIIINIDIKIIRPLIVIVVTLRNIVLIREVNWIIAD